MSIFNKYPYTDYHEMNLDWILNKMKELDESFTSFKAFNTITWKGTWSITSQYTAWSVVESSDHNGYLSIKPVPSGIDITNTNYWVLVANYSAIFADFQNRLSTVEKEFASVKLYGAKGDGLTDDTQAINKCLEENKNVFFPEGTYLISKTLHVRGCSHLMGVSAEKSIIIRSKEMTDDTVIVGSNDDHANNFIIENLWLLRNVEYSGGIISNILGNDVSHIRVYFGQHFFINNCKIWGAPVGINIMNSSLGTINGNSLTGSVWDPDNSAAQESYAILKIGATDDVCTNAYNQLIDIFNNHFGGSYSDTRTITIGSNSVEINMNLGSCKALHVLSCEGLTIHDNYFGGQNRNNVSLNPVDILTEVRIYGNYFEPATEECILVQSDNVSKNVFGLIINGNNFNGQLVGKYALNVLSTGSGVSLYDLIFANNHCENYLASCVTLWACVGAKICGNTFSAYNSRNTNPTDSKYNSAVYISGSSDKITVSGNSFGGGINNLSSDNYCVNGCTVDNTNYVLADNNIDIGLTGAGYLVSGSSSDVSKYTASTTSITQSTNTPIPFDTIDNSSKYFKLDDGSVKCICSGRYTLNIAGKFVGSSTVYTYLNIAGVSSILQYKTTGEGWFNESASFFINAGETISLSALPTDSNMTAENVSIEIV